MDDARAAFVEGGRSIVIATLGDDGLPMGGRAWGAAVIVREPTQLRLVVDPGDASTMANLCQGAAIALTISDVRTLVSLQLKGKVLRVEAATAADEELRRRYCNEFLLAIHETDGEPLDKLERWADRPVAACVIEIHELFDQTPGPSAGNRIAGDV